MTIMKNTAISTQEGVFPLTDDLLLAIINSSVDPVVFIDTDLNIVLFNIAAATYATRVFGSELVRGSYFPDFMTEERKRTVLHYLKLVRNNREVVAEDKLVRHRDEEIWYATKYTPVYDTQETYIGCVIHYSDISRRKQQEEMNRQTRNHLEAVINNSSDSVLFVNTENKVELYNKAFYDYFYKLTGTFPAKGEDVMNVMPMPAREVFLETLEQLKQNRKAHNRYKVTYSDGQEIWFAVNFYPVYDENNTYLGYVINSRDISIHREHELLLSRQNEQLKEIARIQSHELRRPLANILGLIDLLTTDENTPDPQKELLYRLKVSADELDEVIRKITSRAVCVY